MSQRDSIRAIKLGNPTDSKVKSRILSLEEFLSISAFKMTSMKCFVINGHLSEAYLLAWKFKEITLISDSVITDPDTLKLLQSYRISISTDFPSGSGVYYFPTNEIYARYNSQIDSVIVIAKKKAVAFQDSMIEVVKEATIQNIFLLLNYMRNLWKEIM